MDKITERQLNEWLGEDNAIGRDIWERKYRHGDETLDEWFERVSGGDTELKDLISQRKFLFGGRTLANRGVEGSGNYFNCFSLGFIDDDYVAIMDALKEVGITFKTQGGQGVSMSKLRPKGAPIGEHYCSDGIMPFIEMLNCVTQGTSQGGSRKGALMISLDATHKEVMDFINIKTDVDAITKANLSLEIDDKFMEAVKKYYENGEKVVLHISKDYSGHKVEYDITPIDVYKRMMEVVWDYGEPGCIFTERFRNYNFLEFDDKYRVETCNPCVVGDTLVLTDRGYVPIILLVGKETNVWNGEGWSTVVPKKTGENQELLRVTTNYGREIVCTPYHKFILRDGRRVEAKMLRPNDELMPCDFPVIKGNKRLKNPYTQGFFSGDGFNGSDRPARYISFYNGKRHCKDFCVTISRRECSDKRETYKVDVEHEKDFVPNAEYTIKDRLDWLAGLIDSDGCINQGVVQISSINEAFLCKTAHMLETLGIHSTMNISKKASKKYFGEGVGNKVYNCNTLYRISIAASDVTTLNEIGLSTHRVRTQDVSTNRTCKRHIKVKSIDEVNNKQDVYCFTEPVNHSGVFNGILTGQCGEQPLGKQFCCCLGSLNLYEFVKNPFTDNAYFDYDDFAEAVRIASNALDAIIDENAERLPEEMHQYKDNSLNWRNIGLGVFGYADMLMALGLEYGTEDAIHYTDSLFNYMMKCAIESNMQRGADEGAYPKCDPHFIKMSTIYKNHCDNDSKYIAKFRNCSLLSIAPTGSIATMMGLSGGIEPEFALSYTRRTDNLEDEYKIEARVVKDYRRITGDKSDELPNYFVTSADIGWHSRIDTQAAIQYHIDTAISSTVNLPKETTKEEIEQLYLYAWAKNLKGITIFRDGCKRLGILTTDNNKPQETEEDKPTGFNRGDIINVSNDLIGYKRKVTNGCGDFQEQIFFDELTGEPMENYIAMGDGGGCSRNLEAISRLISLCLRGGIDVSEIINQLKKVRACPAYRTRHLTKGDTSIGTSCPSAIGFAVEELCEKIKDRCFADEDFGDYDELIVGTEHIDSNITSEEIKEKVGDDVLRCPECGELIIYEGGCNICKACGWSKCD